MGIGAVQANLFDSTSSRLLKTYISCSAAMVETVSLVKVCITTSKIVLYEDYRKARKANVRKIVEITRLYKNWVGYQNPLYGVALVDLHLELPLGSIHRKPASSIPYRQPGFPQPLTELPPKSHAPGKNTLIRVPPTLTKSWLESTNQVVLRRLLMRFEEDSTVIMPRQLTTSNARVLLFLDAFRVSPRPGQKPTLSGTNVLPLSKRKF
jgi:hypothetical protein